MKDGTDTKYHVLTKWGAEYEITKEDWEGVDKLKGADADRLEITLLGFNNEKLFLKYSEIAGFIAE